MELWDLFDENRIPTGRTMARGEPYPADGYHLVVHACVFNDRGEMLIQHRQPFKQGWPDRWDVTMGGSAVAGDDSRSACEREVLEELGLRLDLSGVRPALTVHFDHGFDDFYIVRRNVEISELVCQPEEVSEAKWADLNEVLRMVDEEKFIPYRKTFLRLLFELSGSDIYAGRVG